MLSPSLWVSRCFFRFGSAPRTQVCRVRDRRWWCGFSVIGEGGRFHPWGWRCGRADWVAREGFGDFGEGGGELGVLGMLGSRG